MVVVAGMVAADTEVVVTAAAVFMEGATVAADFMAAAATLAPFTVAEAVFTVEARCEAEADSPAAAMHFVVACRVALRHFEAEATSRTAATSTAAVPTSRSATFRPLAGRLAHPTSRQVAAV